MLSILTCHCVAQLRLFKRLVHAAVRFDGVGLGLGRRSRLRLQASVTLPSAMVAKLELRNKELSRVEAASGGDGGGKGLPEMDGDPPPITDGDRRPRGAAETAPSLRPEVSRRPPLERCCRLLVRCIRWVRNRQGGNSGKGGGRRVMALVEDALSESSEGGSSDPASRYRDEDAGREEDEKEEEGEEEWGGGGGAECGHSRRGSGGKGGERYSFRPEDVKLATSRECYAAMRSALLEIETGLSSAAGVGSGGAAGGGDIGTVGCGGSISEANLAEVIEAAAACLRVCFAPAVMTPAGATQRKRKGDAAVSLASGSGPRASDAAAAVVVREPTAAVPTEGPLQGGGKRRKSGDGGHTSQAGLNTSASSSSKTAPPPPPPPSPPPPAAIDMFPEQAKLLLMRVLERVFLVGRTAALAASAALAKPPSPAMVAGRLAPAPALAMFSSEPRPEPPPCSSPIPPPSKKRRRTQQQQERVADIAGGKPGDQAGGGPRSGVQDSSTPTGAAAAAAPARTPVRSSQRSRASTAAKVEGEEKARGGGGGGGGSKRAAGLGGDGSSAASPACSRDVVEAGGGSGEEGGEEGGGEGERDALLLASVLPAVVVASGDFLCLVAASRAWTEAQRAKARRAADDPCRKRVSGDILLIFLSGSGVTF